MRRQSGLTHGAMKGRAHSSRPLPGRSGMQAPRPFVKIAAARSLFRSAWKASLAVGVRAISLVAAATGALPLAELTTGLTVAALRKDVDAIEASEDLEPPEDATKALWARFNKLLSVAWGGKPGVILIDDLDRCSPEVALGLLDGLRMLVSGANQANCRFVVALDRRVMAEVVKNRFSGLESFDGNRYLEKVFPLTFRIPAASGREVADSRAGIPRSVLSG